MSGNIHCSEPQAFGLIVLKTTFGELQLELFTKQCPKITQNFVQLCLDGYYNGTTVHRVERDFIAIGGRLEGQDEDGNSIDTGTCPDEFHSRLKFSRRGLVATANTEKNANGPEFFFSLGPAPELQNKHSIFGRLRGDSVYHLVDLNECPVDDELVPICEKKILQIEVVENPFPDLEPRLEIVQALERHRKRSQAPSQTNEQEDYLEPKLEIKSSSKKLSFYQDDSDDDDEDDNDGQEKPAARDNLGEELKLKEEEHDNSLNNNEFKKPSPRASPNGQSENGESRVPTAEEARQKRLREVREQFQSIKRQFECDSATKIRTLSDRRRSQEQDSSMGESMRSSSSKQSSLEDPDLSTQELRLATKKGRHRERETLELMESFRKKLKDTAESKRHEQQQQQRADVDGFSETLNDDDEANLAQALELVEGDAWMRHRFEAADADGPRDAKDANQKGDDWYSIEDPRNPIVQRVEAERAREYAKQRERNDRLEEGRQRSRSSSRDNKHHHSGSNSSGGSRRHHR